MNSGSATTTAFKRSDSCWLKVSTTTVSLPWWLKKLKTVHVPVEAYVQNIIFTTQFFLSAASDALGRGPIGLWLSFSLVVSPTVPFRFPSSFPTAINQLYMAIRQFANSNFKDSGRISLHHFLTSPFSRFKTWKTICFLRIFIPTNFLHDSYIYLQLCLHSSDSTLCFLPHSTTTHYYSTNGDRHVYYPFISLKTTRFSVTFLTEYTQLQLPPILLQTFHQHWVSYEYINLKNLKTYWEKTLTAVNSKTLDMFTSFYYYEINQASIWDGFVPF